MRTVVVFTPPEEILNSFFGGAVARWVYNIYYRLSKETGKFIICGRTSGDINDYTFALLKSRLNGLMFVLMKVPLLRRFSYLITIFTYRSEVRTADIVEVHNSHQMIRWLRFMGYKKRLILHMHNDYLSRVSDKKIMSLEADVDEIIVCSQALQDSLQSRSRILAGRSDIVYNGVDVDLFAPSALRGGGQDSVIKLLYVGRVVPAKGDHLLISVYQELFKLKPDSELKIVGSSSFGGGGGKYLRECHHQITALKNAGANADILGYVHNEKLPELYNWATLFCSFSSDEAFGMTYIEALSCKTLVLANSVGGVSEAVGFEEMLITEDLEASLIVDRILHLSDKTTERKLIEQSYSRTVDLFSWDVLAAQHSAKLCISMDT